MTLLEKLIDALTACSPEHPLLSEAQKIIKQKRKSRRIRPRVKAQEVDRSHGVIAASAYLVALNAPLSAAELQKTISNPHTTHACEDHPETE